MGGQRPWLAEPAVVDGMGLDVRRVDRQLLLCSIAVRTRSTVIVTAHAGLRSTVRGSPTSSSITSLGEGVAVISDGSTGKRCAVGCLSRRRPVHHQVRREGSWESHLAGDELIHILDGTATLEIVCDNGPPKSFTLGAGMVAVNPQGAWHRFQSSEGVTLMAATPFPSEVIELYVDDPRTVEHKPA